MAVFVLDSSGKPLMPCSEKRARLLLDRGRARVHRLVPMVIRIIDRAQTESVLQPLRLKLDPGSKTTGIALVRETNNVDLTTGEIHRSASVLNLIELVHRGQQISEALTARSQMRRRRRGCLRYREPRFLNRGNKKKGWLAPSLQHPVDTSMAWVKKIRCWAPVVAISSELVRFDMQALQNSGISGVEYRPGTLLGYEMRNFVLEKWNRECAYCDAVNLPLQIEHIVPKVRGGSNRASNLTLACQCCNQKKNAQSIEQFLARDPKRLAKIMAQTTTPLRDAAAVNSTRWALSEALKTTTLPVELSSGGRTKFNRSRLSIPKTHALDAVCVGRVDRVDGWTRPTLTVNAMGRGGYQRTLTNKFGLPRAYRLRTKRIHGFATGDMVRADVPKGARIGIYVGRVVIRAKGYFDIQTLNRRVQGIKHTYCRLTQRGDGYGYFFNSPVTTNANKSG